ncbi:MAG TPA: gluconate:H+ symporter [Chryseosolibacter sp.]
MNGFSTPVIGLFVAVFVLIFLVLRTKVHPLIAMILAACIAGVAGGMTLNATVDSITRGFGTTLGSIGIVIGLGVMMGRILEVSGAAEQIARSFVHWLGHRRETWAMALTGYFVSIPIFVDSAFVILFPIVRALAKKTNRSLLALGVALAGGLVVTHTLVPPTPGPLGAAGIFGVDVGAMMLLGMALAIPPVIAVVLYAQWLGGKYPHVPWDPLAVPSPIGRARESEQGTRPPPAIVLSWLPIAVPIALIFVKALAALVPHGQTDSHTVAMALLQVVAFAGTPVIALSVGTLIAVYTLVPWLDRKESNARMEEGLQAAGIILLVTGAGGALGAVVRDSGAGTALARQIRDLPVSPVMLPFFVATAVRLIQGSGTVACITAASITAPVLAVIPEVNMLMAAQSAVAGALCFSYFNDSLFWVVNRMMGLTDIRQQIFAWSLPTTLAWGVAGTGVAVLNLAFGSGGSLVDPVVPIIVVITIVVAIRYKPKKAGAA